MTYLIRALLSTLPRCAAAGCALPSTGYTGRHPLDAGNYNRRCCPLHSEWTPVAPEDGGERARAVSMLLRALGEVG